MVIHWPEGLKSKGEIRSQFTHVTDIAPTIMEAAGLPFPISVNGTEQLPFSGTSFLYAFENPGAPETHTTQYFEMFGNRGIYHNGWVACTRHSIPWVLGAKLPPLKDDVWELYYVDEDFSQANNLASTNPDKLKELQILFKEEAIKNHVFPIDDRRSERFNATIAGRPDLMGTRTELTLFEGMEGISESAFINIKMRSYSITADVEVDVKANGVIISQAGRFGGWTLYMKDGKVHHEYNFFGLEKTNIASPVLAPGQYTIKYEFIIAENKPGSGGKCILLVDGKPVAEGQIPKTQPFMYSADEGVDIGTDNETNVSNDYKEGNNRFTGKIKKVTVSI
jgi:arylsulfatase